MPRRRGCRAGKATTRPTAVAVSAFVMDAMTNECAHLIDSGADDYMLETAMLKVFATEHLWTIVNDTIQIFDTKTYQNVGELPSGPDPEQFALDQRLKFSPDVVTREFLRHDPSRGRRHRRSRP